MKRLLLVALLIVSSFKMVAQSSSTNSFIWSISNMLWHFGYNGTDTFTNAIKFSNSVPILLRGTNSAFVLMTYSNQLFICDSTTNVLITFTNAGISVSNTSFTLPSVNIIGAITNNSAPGFTTNVMALVTNTAAANKFSTNLYQYSNGILTNVVNNY